jgi:hypothetical protein
MEAKQTESSRAADKRRAQLALEAQEKLGEALSNLQQLAVRPRAVELLRLAWCRARRASAAPVTMSLVAHARIRRGSCGALHVFDCTVLLCERKVGWQAAVQH